MRLTRLPKFIWGWAFYDFANSAFATSIITAVFSVYFVKTLVPPEGARVFGALVPAESLWGYIFTGVMLVVIVISPALGARADHRATKRIHLAGWTGVGSLATMALFFVVPGRLWFGFWVIFVAILAYEMALVFYNAFLNDVTDAPNKGRVSGLGYALGYIGGGLCLAVNMAMISRPELFFLKSDDGTLPVRAVFFVVGVWWLIFSLPTFLWVKDEVRVASNNQPVQFHQLISTLKSAYQMKEVRIFGLAYLIYNDGIQTLIIMAAPFGAQAFNMSAVDLILLILIVQFVAFIGAMICGRLADAWSHKKVVLVTLGIYSMVCVWAYVMQHPWEFWTMGVIVGLILGGSQAATRSLFANLIPVDRSGEFFALFAVVSKATAMIGPLIFGLTRQFVGLREALFSLLFFFVLGGVLLWFVKEPRPLVPEEHIG